MTSKQCDILWENVRFLFFFAVGVSKIFKKSCNWCMFRWFIDYEKNVNELRMSKIMLTISPRSLPRLSKWFHFIHRLVPPRGEITFWGSTFNRQNVASGSRIVKNELLMFNKENKPAIPLDCVYVISIQHRRWMPACKQKLMCFNLLWLSREEYLQSH